MKEFTATQLKNSIGEVLSHVQKHSKAVIVSKSRPDFLIIERSEYDKLIEDRDSLINSSGE